MGILYATHRITSINKMNIPIQLNYCTRTSKEKGKFFYP